MNQSLIVYAIIGAVGFSTLSAVATKYRDDDIQVKHLLCDAVAGAICTAFLFVLVPDMFPQLSLLTVGSAAMAAAASSVTHKMTGGGSSNDDYDLQVGYMKRRA